MLLKKFAAMALLSTALCNFAYADTNGPIKSVTLSSGGLAEIIRSASVEDKGAIRMDVPLEQVDDILKSLVVRDSSGTVKNISLAGPNPIEETFKGLPFTASDLATLPSLLSTLQGTAVSVTSNGKSLSGQVLGVENRPDGDGKSKPLLTVLTDDGIKSVVLADDAALTVTDPEMQRKIAEASAVMGKGKSGGSRTVTINLGGEGNRTVDLSYVVLSPIWKASYRVVVGKEGEARLQAWAVLENASGEDWKGVKITLSTGDPVTLSQKLHQRYWRERPEVPIDTSSGIVPLADNGNLANRAKVRKQTSLGQRAEIAPAAPTALAFAGDAAGAIRENFSMTAAADTGTVNENAINATYSLPGVYDLANGDTLSIPIVDAKVKAEMISVFTPDGRSTHPVAAVMLDNSTANSMPKGILTVYDEATGYVGDSKLLDLPPGETRIASFAVDGKVSIVQDRKPDELVTDVKVVDDIIQASVKSVDRTTYTVSGAVDGDRTVVIEQPRREGWTFKSDAEDGRTATHHRLKVKVTAGSEELVTATYEMLRDDVYALTDAEPQILLSFAGSAADEQTASKFRELAEARQKQVLAQNAIQRINQHLAQETEAQARIRQNLSAVTEGSDLQKKYLTMLEDRENKIAELEEGKKVAEKEYSGHEKKVSGIIRTF